jgi:hypothetical protein
MIKKFAFTAMLSILIAGCAGLPEAQTAGPLPLQVRGDLVDMTQVKIFVNGNKVIDDEVSLLYGKGEFRGTYAGKPVLANCTTAPQPSRTTCVVSIENEPSRTLKF